MTRVLQSFQKIAFISEFEFEDATKQMVWESVVERDRKDGWSCFWVDHLGEIGKLSFSSSCWEISDIAHHFFHSSHHLWILCSIWKHFYSSYGCECFFQLLNTRSMFQLEALWAFWLYPLYMGVRCACVDGVKRHRDGQGDSRRRRMV